MEVLSCLAVVLDSLAVVLDGLALLTRTCIYMCACVCVCVHVYYTLRYTFSHIAVTPEHQNINIMER